MDYRLFIAIPVPSAVQEALGQAQDKLREALPLSGIRWGRPDQIHLTLRFLGDVPEERVAGLTQALEGVCAAVAPLPLAARGLGCFPESRRPRVLWAGVDEPAAERASRRPLTRLKTSLDATAHAFTGEPPEAHFSPHLTLGRFKFVVPAEALALAKLAHGFAQHSFGSWTAENLELMRSELAPEGPVHTCLAKVSFSAVPRPAGEVKVEG